MSTNTDKRLYLVDAFAMIFRGYYAFIKSPRINSKKLDTSAIFGFMNSLIELIKREKPSHLVVAFDLGGPTLRHEEFAEYKANRQETPEAIKIAVPYILAILKAMKVPCLSVQGYEADDVIGTIAKKAEQHDYQVFMVTPDKDYAQLVSDNIKMYRPAMNGKDVEIWGIEEVKAKFEVDNPLQVIDYLGMMGDASDNIPGLEGVGEKTAKKFLKEYGSMEGLLANTHQLKGKMKEKVEASAERGLLSKKLATIDLEVPVAFEPENYDLEEPNFDEVKLIFDDLEFNRLYDNLLKYFNQSPQATSPAATQSPSNAQPNLFDYANFDENPAAQPEAPSTAVFYQCIDQAKSLKILVNNLFQQEQVSIQAILSNQNHDADILALSFASRSGLAYYVPLQDEKEAYLEILKAYLESDKLKIGHDLKPLIKALSHQNIQMQGPLFDVMIAHYILNPDSKHEIELLAKNYLSFEMSDSLSFKNQKNQSLDIFQNDVKSPMARALNQQADAAWRLHEAFAPQLQKTDDQQLFAKIEMPLLKVLAKMESEGILLDKASLKLQSESLSEDLARLETQIFELSGEQFNLNSPKQLGEVLFEKMQLDPKAKKTKTGQFATGEEVLQKLADKHPIMSSILEYRQLQKLKSTYVDALPQQVDAHSQRVHTSFMQHIAATGRLSSINPNLQNIPIRTQRGQQVREAFVAKPGCVILSADYSQIELRLIAEMSHETAMREAFINGIDIHTATAAKLYNISIDEVSREQRSNAKTVNFGIIYGVSAFGLSEQTSLSRSEAKEMIETYLETYPQLKSYMDSQVALAREQGYVSTLLGRRRYLKDINSSNFTVRGHAERNAVNAPVQGSAADIIKLAMIAIDKAFAEQQIQSKMLLQVHDELVFEVPESEIAQVSEIIKTNMMQAYQTQIPLEVELGQGQNWLQAH